MCECGNEPSGSIKCGEFRVYLKTGYFLKKDSVPGGEGGGGREGGRKEGRKE
jgi:hypothetical protein